MPPKAKEVYKKPPPPIVRPAISDSSLVYVPEDAIEGYQERIETGIDWTLVALGLRLHRQHAQTREDLPTVTFCQALENKINKSVLGGFLDEESNISLDDQLDLILATKLWDTEKFATAEGKACFDSENCLTDNVINLIKTSVKTGRRKALWEKLLMVEVLRVNDQKMTELDKSILEFKQLVTLNLCGNYIQNIEAVFIPQTLRSLELQTNHISDIIPFAEFLPPDLLYLGLSRNLMKSENAVGLSLLPAHLTVLDISDNDIYDLDAVLDAVLKLHNLSSLYLAGNPCSVCAGYARRTLQRLRRLKWLDARKVLPTDRTIEPVEIHPDDLRSTYFYFSIFRVMSAPPPPKAEKGATTAFHVELEIPLLDVARRRFLLFRNNESLTEMLPMPEDDEVFDEKTIFTTSAPKQSKVGVDRIDEAESHESDIYEHLEPKNSRIINNFTTFESNKVQWAKIMTFQDPTVKIFCPDMFALRDTFRSVITIRLVYSVIMGKPPKVEKKSVHVMKPMPEQRVTIATIRCALQNPDWSQASQHFHWDDSLGTNDAIHWGDGDLDILTYTQAPVKVSKGKQDRDDLIQSSRQQPPENLTCHFGFGIDTLRATP